MNKTLLALYGLKWNPFAPAVPASALHVGPRIDEALLFEACAFTAKPNNAGAAARRR